MKCFSLILDNREIFSLRFLLQCSHFQELFVESELCVSLSCIFLSRRKATFFVRTSFQHLNRYGLWRSTASTSKIFSPITLGTFSTYTAPGSTPKSGPVNLRWAMTHSNAQKTYKNQKYSKAQKKLKYMIGPWRENGAKAHQTGSPDAFRNISQLSGQRGCSQTKGLLVSKKHGRQSTYSR